MSIHQTTDGRWFAAYRELGERKVKRKYFGRGGEGKVAAKKWEAEFLSGAGARPDAPPQPGLTFAALAQRYLDTRSLAENTRKNMLYALNAHVLPRWGEARVTSLSMVHLVEVDEALAARGRSMATRNRVRVYCRAICQWGEDNDLIPANPFRRFRPETKKEGRAPDLVTDEELAAIYAAAPAHLCWMLEVMMNTGARPGPSELFSLKMTDVDFKGEGIWITRRKTDSPRALLPLRLEFLARLKTLAEAEPGRTWLIEYEGEPVTTMKTAWKATKRRAGISRRLRPYDLRHWYATKMLTGGADIKAASELMGHASPRTTLATYYHLMEGQKRAALDHLHVPDLARAAGKPLDKPEARK
jgi:integrase